MNNSEVAHVWAQQTKARATGSNFYFEGPHLYSYGRHFMVGRILPSGVAVLTSRSYSVTTARHIIYARQAVSHRTVVYCNDPADTAGTNMRAARAEIADRLAWMQKKGIRQTTRDKLALRAQQIADEANAYLAALPADERGDVAPIDVSNLQGLAEERARAIAAAATLQKERQAARMAETLETLAKWRTGEVLQSTGLYDLPAALRLRHVSQGVNLHAESAGPARIVETSHGASIPVADALKLWPIILRVKAGSKDYTPGEPLGNYRLTQIRTDGSIRVGCHDIAFSEIEGIAQALGLLETVGA